MWTDKISIPHIADVSHSLFGYTVPSRCIY